MDWGTWMLWDDLRKSQEAEEASENGRLREEESEKDYYNQFDD